MRKRKKVIITISAVILTPVLLLALTVFLLEFYAPERIVERYKTELTETAENILVEIQGMSSEEAEANEKEIVKKLSWSTVSGWIVFNGIRCELAYADDCGKVKFIYRDSKHVGEFFVYYSDNFADKPEDGYGEGYPYWSEYHKITDNLYWERYVFVGV